MTARLSVILAEIEVRKARAVLEYAKRREVRALSAGDGCSEDDRDAVGHAVLMAAHELDKAQALLEAAREER